MFIKTPEKLREAGKKYFHCDGALREIGYLTGLDGLGFSVSDVYCSAGFEEVLWYKPHWEANYILQGHGKVLDFSTGEQWALAPGVMCIVGPQDRHSVEALTDLHLISIFNPPLQGNEQHDVEVTLPASGPLPPGIN